MSANFRSVRLRRIASASGPCSAIWPVASREPSLTITISTLVAGFLAERFSPAATTWTMVSLAAIAAMSWIAFARPVWRRADG